VAQRGSGGQNTVHASVPQRRILGRPAPRARAERLVVRQGATFLSCGAKPFALAPILPRSRPQQPDRADGGPGRGPEPPEG
jgi:hypothetical protein